MTAMAATPALDTATRRLLYCVLASVALHTAVSTLKPGMQFGTETPAASVARTLAVLEVTLGSRGEVTARAHAEGETGQPTRQTPGAAGADQSAAVSSPLPAFQPPQKHDLPPVVNGMFVGPWYYAAQYLHRRPSPLRPIRPDYPALADNETHTVRILMLISATGSVDSYRVTGESDTPFAKTVIQAFTTVEYAPGLISNIPVKSQLLAEVTFNPGDGNVQANLWTPDGVNLQTLMAPAP